MWETYALHMMCLPRTKPCPPSAAQALPDMGMPHARAPSVWKRDAVVARAIGHSLRVLARPEALDPFPPKTLKS